MTIESGNESKKEVQLHHNTSIHKKDKLKKVVFRYFALFVGALLTAIGLEEFLIPNNIIDGGVVGVSIITSYLTNLPLGIFTTLFNIPFLFMGYKIAIANSVLKPESCRYSGKKA